MRRFLFLRLEWLFPFQIESRNQLFRTFRPGSTKCMYLCFKSMLRIDFSATCLKSDWIFFIWHSENHSFCVPVFEKIPSPTYRFPIGFTVLLQTGNILPQKRISPCHGLKTCTKELVPFGGLWGPFRASHTETEPPQAAPALAQEIRIPWAGCRAPPLQ